MAHRPARRFWQHVLTAIFLVMTAQRSEAQPAQRTKQELDDLIVKAFGNDCAELRMPIRMWFPDIDMVIAAEKADLVQGLAYRFTAASIGSPGKSTNIDEFRGAEILIHGTSPITFPGVKSAWHRNFSGQTRRFGGPRVSTPC